MVFLHGLKYACATCVKGHRSSACHHADRPLFEIKKKGRPITQCQHCRELRKTKQVHVKCMCTDKIKKEHGHSGHSGLNLNAPDLPHGIATVLGPQRTVLHAPSPPEESPLLPYCGTFAPAMNRLPSQGCQCAAIHAPCQCDPTKEQQFVVVKHEPGVLPTPPLDNQGLLCSCTGQPMLLSYSSDSEESGAQDQTPLISPRPVYPINQVNLDPQHVQYIPQSQPTPPNSEVLSWNSYPNLAIEDAKTELPKLEAMQSDDSDCKVTPPLNQYDDDDIDNDTPRFNSGELNNDVPREQTLLGPLQETSSEDLMTIIYSEFRTSNTTSKPNPNTDGSPHLLHAERPPTCNSCSSASLVSTGPPGDGGKIINENDGFAVTSEDGITRRITTEEAQRMVNCRCGDDCACSGCLVHPREVMRNALDDPYAGYEGEGVELNQSSSDNNTRQIGISDDDSVMLCSSDCEKLSGNCGCVDSMCEEYLPKHP